MQHRAWTFHIVTLGCKINQYESQAIREAWIARSGVEVPLEAGPDVFLVNSCAITARGERDTRHALYRLQKLFTAETAQPCLRILTGCAASLVAKTFADKAQEKYFDVLIPPQAKALLMQEPAKWGGEDFFTSKGLEALSIPAQVYPFGEQGFSIKAFHRARPVLKVQDGCSHRCTYCIVPLVRGKSISRPALDVVAEAQRLLEAGYGEIMLSGINLHQYGRELKAQDNAHVADFWDLVALLEKHLAPTWAGRARFRISSLEPSQLGPKGLEVLSSSSLLCPHIHLSLQHGSPSVLKRMGRGHYKLLPLLDNVRKLRASWPHMGLGADILMGFAGETEQDVQDTLTLIKELGLNYAHVFPYSIRPGTAAEKFSEQVPHAEKLERAGRVRALVAAQQQAFLQTLLTRDSVALVLDNKVLEDEAEPPLPHDSFSESAGMSTTKVFKGVEAHYASCQLQVPASLHLKGIVQARPVGIEGETLLCELLHKG